MPIYEYECTSCHHHFDLMQKISDEPAKQCPHCFQDTLTKLVSAAGFQLKGTGWYATDFKDKGKPASNTASTKTSEPTTVKDAADKSAATTSSEAKSSTTKGTNE